MCGFLKRVQSTSGENTRGELLAGTDQLVRPRFVSSSMGWPQWPHSVLIVTVTSVRNNVPSTKGAAIASTAQAAYTSSPVLNFSRWGV